MTSPLFLLSEEKYVCAGTLIYPVKKNDANALPNTRLMIHEPPGGAQGQSRDLEITAKDIIRTREKINQLISRKSGKDIEYVRNDTARDY